MVIQQCQAPYSRKYYVSSSNTYLSSTNLVPFTCLLSNPSPSPNLLSSSPDQEPKKKQK